MPPVVRRRAALLVLALSLSLGSTFLAPTAAYAALPSAQTWSADVAAALAAHGSQPSAMVWVQRQVRQHQPGDGKLALNLDIDNTSIATHYDWPHAVPRVLKLAQTYQPQGVYLLFNTGRYADQLTDIKQKLRAAGFRYYLVCGRQHGEGLTTSKQRCRRSFVSQGFRLIANIGNNTSDFAGTQNFEASYDLPDYGGQLS